MKSKDRYIEEMDRKQREAEIIEQNLKKILEEEINQKALKIGRKILDEMYLHGENKIEVSIKRSSLLGLDVIEIVPHQITGLLDNEIEHVKRGNIKEK